MRRVLLVLVAAACGSSAPPAPVAPAPAPAAPPVAAADPAPPTLRLPRTVKPVRYAVELALDPEADGFSGRVEVELELAAPEAVVWLHAYELTVEKAAWVNADGERPARIVPGDARTVGFAVDGVPLAPAHARLRIWYRGKANDSAVVGVFRVKEGDRWYLYSKFESVFARRAFPCFDEPGFKVPWQLTIRHPRELVALSNTAEERHVDEGDTRVTTFAETPPLPSYLVAFAVGPFELVDAGVHGRQKTAVRVIVPAGQGGKAAYAAQIAGRAFEWLEGYFDVPYPYGKLDLLVAPQYPGAMENAALILFGSRTVLGEPGQIGVKQKAGMAKIIAHEIAHMWFGDLVTMAWWDDLWLNEAFASWLENKAVAALEPGWQVEVANVEERGEALSADARAAARRIRQPIAGEDDIIGAFDSITYEKGAAVLAMFESFLGAEPFRRGVHEYLEKHRFGSATSGDFLGALGAAAGRDVAADMGSFLDQAGFPMIDAKLSCAGGPPRLELTQRRYVPAGGATDSTARWRVPVCVRYPGGKGVARACTVLAEEHATLALGDAAKCPAWVVPNDNAMGYYHTGAPELVTAAVKARVLAPRERAHVAAELAELAVGGRAPVGQALAVLPALAADREPRIVLAAVDAAEELGHTLIAPELEPGWRRAVARIFGGPARRLGVAPRRGESEATRQLRGPLVSLVASDGGDAKLRAGAVALADRWLSDRAALDPDTRTDFMWLAGETADAARLDRMIAALRATSDAVERAILLRALVQPDDPAVLRRGLDYTASAELNPRDGFTSYTALGRGGAEHAAVVFAFTRERFDDLLPRLPPNYARTMIKMNTGLCDAAARREAEAFFTPRVGKILNGPRELAVLLESIDLCIAARVAQAEALAAALR